MHRFLRWVFLPLTLVGCLSPSGSNGATKSGRESLSFTKQANVIYTPEGWPKPLAADLYLPERSGPGPAVLLLYGGAWKSADHRWQMRGIARKLARRGYVVMSATYRGVPEYRYPAPVEDLQEALRWLRRHAAEYQIRPDRIGAFGYSAGAHLAALLGTLDAPPELRLQAVVAGGTPADLTFRPGGELVPRFLGGTFAEIPDVFRAASPITHVSADDPPFFLYHGTDDTLVWPDNATRFKAALDRANVPNELYWLENRGHVATLFLGGRAEDAAIDFLDRHLRRP